MRYILYALLTLSDIYKHSVSVRTSTQLPHNSEQYYYSVTFLLVYLAAKFLGPN